MIFTIKSAVIEDKQIIFDLFQPYLEELSSFPDEEIDYKDEKGIYHYPYLDDHWRESVRHPYLLLCDNEIAGFALVRKAEEHPEKHWEIAEFYVLPEFRRHGLATSCAIDIFKKHQGKWRIEFNKNNHASRVLWQKVAARVSSGCISFVELNIGHDYIGFSC
jgi:predicted acetyltransferase